ncbi:prolyl oligopeptidase family serine peptidase [Blastopirellula marina]|uniref:Peptidase S9 prolyl oligopeptidase catalytic domain-containing protein n=1 Tax=Blastopirellula marina TaxID=124 RepID=A0A2S8GSC0_9BACT|nr:prolyl oligopeptidase family serine peptidase [Blastopirellula marina]PQO47326.1 hypothetical protein C5Y93_04605 [Blastopirellula marina]
MTIRFQCPGCNKTYQVEDQLAGKQAKCKACGASMAIPSAASPPPEPEPADDLFEYGLKENPFPTESTSAPLPPKPRVATPSPSRQTRSNSGLKTLLIVFGSIFGGFTLLLVVCCGAVMMLPSGDGGGARVSGGRSSSTSSVSTFQRNLQSFIYQPIPAPTSSHAIPGSDVRVAFVESHGSGPAGKMQLRIYMPPGKHEPGSLPCVLVAPAGTPLLHGNAMDDDDYHKETLPYAEAGMIVVFYSLDGPEEEDHPAQMAKDGKGAIVSYKEFRDACAGVTNGKNVVEYVVRNIPQADPDKIFAAGHSSAGTVSLLLGAYEPKLAGVVAFAPCSDVEGRLGDLVGIAGVNIIFPGIKQFLHDSSPDNCAAQIDCPVFLFHARDDSNVEFSESLAFSKQLTQAGVDVTFVPVNSGEHYSSMVNEGVPKAVDWIRERAK